MNNKDRRLALIDSTELVCEDKESIYCKYFESIDPEDLLARVEEEIAEELMINYVIYYYRDILSMALLDEKIAEVYVKLFLRSIVTTELIDDEFINQGVIYNFMDSLGNISRINTRLRIL